jgi:hypothetical protein
MRNARTLVERIVLSKAIEGELRTFDVDLHQTDGGYAVYVYDPDEAFTGDPLFASQFEQAKILFDECVALIMKEPVLSTDTPYDFAERVYDTLRLTKTNQGLEE